jgi:hypothetical protein
MNPHAAPVDRRARPCLSGRARGGSVSVIGGTDPQRLKPANDFQDLDPRLSARALHTRARTKASLAPRRPCGRLRKFVGRSGLVVVSNPRRPPTGRGPDTQGDTGDAAQTAAENGSRSLQKA